MNNNDTTDESVEIGQINEDFYDTHLETIECTEQEKQSIFNDRHNNFKVETSTAPWTCRNECGLRSIELTHKKYSKMMTNK